MVSLIERDQFVTAACEDPELAPVYAYFFGENWNFGSMPGVLHLLLLEAIVVRDTAKFQEHLAQLEMRRIIPESSWYDNDLLVFLLILGCDQFNLQSPAVDSILAVREGNPNAVPRKVNQIFRALSRKEFAMEGEFAFIKVLFLHLVGTLRLDVEEAGRIYSLLIRPGFISALNPILRLMALRAYDLVLTERTPKPLEGIRQIIEAVDKHKDQFNLKQICDLVGSLPVKILWGATGVIITILCAVFAGGAHWAELSSRLLDRKTRPETLIVDNIIEAQKETDSLVASLAHILKLPNPDSTVMAVETKAIGSESGKFSAEITVAYPLVGEAYAFAVDEVDGGKELRVLPIRKLPSSLRAFVSASKPTTRLLFIVPLHLPPNYSSSAVSNAITLRALD